MGEETVRFKDRLCLDCGYLITAGTPVGGGPAVERVGVLGVQFDGFGEVGDGGGEVVAVGVDGPAVVVRGDVGRVQIDGPREVFDGPGEVAGGGGDS